MALHEEKKISELFLKYDFPETKDMCKQFLTLVTSILVLSVTFYDKVLKIGNEEAEKLSSPQTSEKLLVSAWGAFFFAIIFCGLGLTFLNIAGGKAVYSGEQYSYLKTARKSYILIVISCFLFVTGLLLLMLSAGISIFRY